MDAEELRLKFNSEGIKTGIKCSSLRELIRGAFGIETFLTPKLTSAELSPDETAIREAWKSYLNKIYAEIDRRRERMYRGLE